MSRLAQAKAGGLVLHSRRVIPYNAATATRRRLRTRRTWSSPDPLDLPKNFRYGKRNRDYNWGGFFRDCNALFSPARVGISGLGEPVARFVRAPSPHRTSGAPRGSVWESKVFRHRCPPPAGAPSLTAFFKFFSSSKKKKTQSEFYWTEI